MLACCQCSADVELMDFLEMGRVGRVGHFWVDSRDTIASKKGCQIGLAKGAYNF